MHASVDRTRVHNLIPTIHTGMASCLLTGPRRAEQILLRPRYAIRTGIFNGNTTSSHWAASALRQRATRHDRSREISTSAPRKDYHFDTHQFVQRLEREGLTRGQAEGVMNSMAEVIDESIRTMTRNMVTKSEQEKAVYTQKVDFGQLKTELQLMERNDLATLKAENDRLMADLEKLKQRLREEITRTQAGVRLDLNLEKGRLRDESGAHEIKIREVETRIETEIAALRTAIQTSKATTLQYLVTFVTGCSALLMAYMRFRF